MVPSPRFLHLPSWDRRAPRRESSLIGIRFRATQVIGSGVVIGPDCRIGTHASLSHALLGAGVYVYAGARIGQEGFGFASTEAGFLTVPPARTGNFGRRCGRWCQYDD